MRKKVLLSILLAAMLALAGCGGTGSQTTTDHAETTTADGTVGPASLGPDTKATHEQALRDAGSFTATNNVTMQSNGSAQVSEISITSEYAVNFTADRALSTSSGFLGTTAKYTGNDTTYKQRKMSEDTTDKNAQYSVASAPYNTSDSKLQRGVQPVNASKAMGSNTLFTENVTYDRVGTDTHNGVKLAVFNASGQQAIDELKAGMSDEALKNSTITQFQSTVKVDDKGIVRYQRVSLTYVSKGKEATVVITHNITNVGETTVDEPAWLEYAKNQSS